MNFDQFLFGIHLIAIIERREIFNTEIAKLSGKSSVVDQREGPRTDKKLSDYYCGSDNLDY